jgi:hypothetical protein
MFMKIGQSPRSGPETNLIDYLKKKRCADFYGRVGRHKLKYEALSNEGGQT